MKAWKRKSVAWLCFVFVVLFCLVADGLVFGQCPAPNSSISGVVTSPDGQPLDDVLIKAQLLGFQFSYRTFSGNDGFGNPGSYDLWVDPATYVLFVRVCGGTEALVGTYPLTSCQHLTVRITVDPDTGVVTGVEPESGAANDARN